MKLTTRDLTHMSIMAALTLVSSFIAIPLGPVAVTLQTLFVLLTGLLFTPVQAFYTQLLNLLLMLLLRGPQIIISPSFGFLISFIVVATLLAWLKESGRIKKASHLVIIGTVISYVIGTPYMAFILNQVLDLNLSFKDILYAGVLLFLPGDAMKALLSIGFLKSINRVTVFQNKKKTH